MFFDKPETQSRISDTKALGEPTTFAERTIATYEAGLVRDRANSRQFNLADAYDERIKAIRDGLGVEMVSPMNRGGSTGAEMGVVDQTDWHSEFQKELEALAKKHPDKADIIGADKPVGRDVQKRYDATIQRETDASRNYGGLPGTGPIADFAGGMAAVARDPVQAPTFLLGPTSPVRQGIRAIIGMGLKQGAVNAGTQAMFEPIIQQYRKDMGDVYGISEAALNIGMAGALGFGLDAGVRGAARGIQKGLGRVAITDPASGGVVGYESKAASEARAKAAERIKAIETIAPETIQRAQAGDLPAIKEVLTATGEMDDPSVRGAIQALELHPELKDSPIEDLDYGARERQMMRALTDGAEPFPVDVPPVRQATGPDLNDFAELPKGIDGNQHYRNFDIDGKPVRFEAIDSKSLSADPGTFQFKTGRDGAGASGRLDAVDYDPALGGRVIAFERADGSLAIVDGHDRLSMVMRMDEPAKMDGFVFKESDGWTAAEVRGLAAKKNVQEGSASLMDAARALRQHPEIVDASLRADTDFMATAKALARLSDEAFAMVDSGRASEAHGRIVADVVGEASKHGDILDKLTKAEPKTEVEARRLVKTLADEGLQAEDIEMMLGSQAVPRHIAEPRENVLAGVLGALRGSSETTAIAAVIKKLSTKPGFVSETLNRAGRAVAEGQPLDRAIDATLRRFETVINDAGVKGLADGPLMLAPPPKTPVGQSVSDFAKTVSGLREKFGVQKKPTSIKADAEDATILPDGAPRFLASIAPFDPAKDLKKILEEIKTGSRIVVVKQYADEFAAAVDEIERAAEQLKAIDVEAAARSELDELVAAVQDFVEVVQAKVQHGYDASERVDVARDFISEQFEKLSSDLYSSVRSVSDDQGSRVELVRERLSDEIEARVGEDGLEAIDAADVEMRDLLPADPKFPDTFSQLDVIRSYREQWAGTVGDLTAKVDDVVVRAGDVEALDQAALVALYREASDLESNLGMLSSWAERMEGEADALAARVYDDVEAFNDQVVRPAIDKLENVESDVDEVLSNIQDRIADIDDEPAVLASLRSGDAATGKSMRADLDALGYYSKALEAAKSWPQGKGTPEQALMWLKKSGVKDAEIEATKVGKAFEGQKSITRDDLVKHLTENRVGLRESKYGIVRTQADADLLSQLGVETGPEFDALRANEGLKEAKFASYSLDPSNPTYRETVLHLPDTSRTADSIARELGFGGWSGRLTAEQQAQIFDIQAKVGSPSDVFKSGHFPEPNITGHMMTSMVKHEGKPVYLIDQIQSDWGQKLRDGGIRDEAKIAELKSKWEEAQARADAINAQYRETLPEDHRAKHYPSDANDALSQMRAKGEPLGVEWAKHFNDARLFAAEYRQASNSAAGNPLVNTTDQWTTTTLRRALRQAAEADAEFIAIPTGETVLSYNPGDINGMRSFYGAVSKEQIERFDAASRSVVKAEVLEPTEGIVPKNLRKILEKLDKEAARPQSVVELETPSKGMAGKGFTLFPLTDKVKRSVIEEGQPLFASRGDSVKTAKDLEAFSQNLESVLRDAQKPVPPRLMDNVLKEGPKQTAEMMERYQGEVTLAAYRNAERAAAVLDRAARMQQFSPGFSIRNIFDRQMKTPGFVGVEPFDLSNVQIKSRAEGDVPVKAVKTIQKTVSLNAVKDRIKNPRSDLPSVFKFGDSYYINDGNHRITAAKAQGLDTIRAEIIEIEAKGAAGSGPADAASKPVGAGADNPTLAQLVFDQIDAQRSGYADAIEQATRILDDAYPGARQQIQSILDAAPALRDRLSELVGTDRAQATAVLRDAMPAPAKPDMPPQVDVSQPLLYTSAANARMAEIRAEIDRTMQMLPPDVRIRVEDQLVWNADGKDVRVDGLWDGYDRIVYVSLAAGDPVRTVRHEVIHALRQSKLMTDDEFNTLYAFAEKLKLRGAYNIDAEYAQKYAAVYGHKGQDYVEMLLREETIANMFSDYSLNGRRFGDIEGGSIIDKIIDRVVQFMKQVRNGLNLFGFREVRDIFEEIESGRMAQRDVGDTSPAGSSAIQEVLAPIIARAVEGAKVERDASGMIASVVRGGRKFMVERDDTGRVTAVKETRTIKRVASGKATDMPADQMQIRDKVERVFVSIVGDTVDPAVIRATTDDMMRTIAAGDGDRALKTAADFVAENTARPVQRIDQPQTGIGRDLADVQATRDVADLVSVCKS